MNKSQAIQLLECEGWTKADAIRALEEVDFNTDPDELTIRRASSSFAGSELSKRQRLQAAQKGLVTKKNKEIELKEQKCQEYTSKNNFLEINIQSLTATNNNLIEVNDILKRDNRDLKNIIDQIKLKLAMDTKKLLQYEDSEIRKAVIKIFKLTLG